jgi:flagellar M-ring protein FliF
VKQLLASLTRRQKITIAVAAVAVIAALMTFLHWNNERDFRPLYSGLAQEDAAAVLAKVRESGTEFRLGDGGAVVLVPSAKVAELRLQLASAGVPRSGRIGYELFDKANFGASDFAEQINYHRALEGELERSVMALSEVEQARVHITFPKDSVFEESRQPAKASVLVKLRAGARLSPQNVAAICQLTASAIEGLQAEAVSVVDVRGNLLSRPHKAASPGDAEPSGAVLEYRQQIERDLLAKINTTLDPLLGADKFRAGVSVECDFSSSEQSDETFDPAKSVMATSLRTEDMTGVTQASGVPGTASTLPRPAPRPAPSSGGVTRRTENVAYQSSRTVRHVKLPVGTVKHMSVSVLVDHAVRWEGTGPKAKRTVEPPTPEKLKAIRELVAGIVGLSTERGDQLVVEALPFEATLAPEQLLPPGGPATTKPAPGDNIPQWVRDLFGGRFVLAGIAAGVVLGLGLLFLVLKKRHNKNKIQAEIQSQLSGPHARKAIDGGENAKEQMEAQIAEQSATKRRQEIEAMAQLKLPQVTTKKAEVLTKHIAEEAKKDATSMVQVLRNWINERDHPTR